MRVAEVFREAIRRNTAALIVCHNHPSGVADPSPDDVIYTYTRDQALADGVPVVQPASSLIAQHLYR